MALIIACAATVALLVAGGWVYTHPTQRVNHLGCLEGQAIAPKHTVILIDQTDRLDATQIDYVRKLVVQEYLRLAPYERFTVTGLDGLRPEVDSNEASLESLSRCRVLTGNEIDPMTQNAATINATFANLVGAPLGKVMSSLPSITPAETSPILETINDLIEQPEFGSQVKRRLVIVSDMAQHMLPPGTSHYPDKVTGQVSFQARPSRQSLSGMQVRVHYIVRDSLAAVQTREHVQFWRTYFETSGSTDVHIGYGLPINTQPENDKLEPVNLQGDLIRIDVPSRDSTMADVPAEMREPAQLVPIVQKSVPARPSITAPSPVIGGNDPPSASVSNSALPTSVTGNDAFVGTPVVSIPSHRQKVNFRAKPFRQNEGATALLGWADGPHQLNVQGKIYMGGGEPGWYEVLTSKGKKAYVRSDLTDQEFR